jgi:hypothetical protein
VSRIGLCGCDWNPVKSKEVVMNMRSLLQNGLLMLFLTAYSGDAALAQDVQVNSKDSNASNLSNFTTESETSAARRGLLIVVGYNTSRQAGLLGAGAFTSLSGYAYSTDGGASFTDGGFVPASGTYVLQGDPTLAFDSSGNVYYGSLLADPPTNCSYIAVSKSTSTSPSVSFADPVVISGPGSCSEAFEDKEFLTVDNTTGPFNGRVYIAWSEFPKDGNPQALLAASSSTSPLAFSPTIILAPSPDSFQHGTFPIVGPDGTVYVAWSTLTSVDAAAAATINLVKSTNGGSTFGNLVTVATFTSTVGDVGSGGMSLRTRSFPYLAVDNTSPASPTHNNLYVVYQAQPADSAPPRSEIFFTSSTDSGANWSTPRSISSGPAVTEGADSTNNDNWSPSIAVSPTTGQVRVLFYSRREDSANQKIRVYEAGSNDAGKTWYNRPFSSNSFTPSVGYDPLLVANYMGDYLSALADSSGLFGVWGDTRNVCSPPAEATLPCTPTNRPDQDAWSHIKTDSTVVAAARMSRSGSQQPATQTSKQVSDTQQTSKTSEVAPSSVPQQPSLAKEFQLTVPSAPKEVHRSLVEYLASEKLKIIQNDREKLLISSSAVQLTHQQLLESITPNAQKSVPPNATGKYFVTFKTTNVGASAASPAAKVQVSTRILIVTSQDLDSPLGGRIVTSNGAIEQNYMNALASRFELK